ncbi:MAG: hypothetical protein D6740_12290 [Alphaproteobacteria bacterium]|nr:MAG: hypothetical protein D6740_12290 [Alphaproteobacteria bacterium]
MQGERKTADPAAEADGGHGEEPAIDVGEIWRRYRLPILLVGLLTLVTFLLFVVVIVGLGMQAATYLAGR